MSGIDSEPRGTGAGSDGIGSDESQAATAFGTEHLLQLIDRIQQRVWQQFGYDLELQIRIW